MEAIQEMLRSTFDISGEEIFMEAKLKEDLGCDSTMALQLALEIRKKFEIPIDQPTSRQENKDWSERIETVGKMYHYILNNLPEHSPFREEKAPA